ncbi:hypothetical protein LUU34_01357400 [Aix galericulata]|nr:hypothetical protein LUU34_01357400 [Aix galericulata]
MTTVSHGAERQAPVFKNFTISAEPLHRIGHQQYQNLSKKTCMPLMRGPENRHDFASFEEKDSNSFLKFHPHTPPVGPNYPSFPHRDDVPLVDPCSGFVSAGGDADLQPHVGRTIESLVDYSDVKPQQRVPIAGKGARTAHRRHMILQEETSQDRRTPNIPGYTGKTQCPLRHSSVPSREQGTDALPPQLSSPTWHLLALYWPLHETQTLSQDEELRHGQNEGPILHGR